MNPWTVDVLAAARKKNNNTRLEQHTISRRQRLVVEVEQEGCKVGLVMMIRPTGNSGIKFRNTFKLSKMKFKFDPKIFVVVVKVSLAFAPDHTTVNTQSFR